MHIVSLDAPAPPDYGGAIDIYYKIIALAATGKKVILHFFDYKKGRGVQGLEQYCHKIYRYPRLTGIRAVSFHLPYIVNSRINKQLIDTLNQDNYSVILEGIHCTGILPYIQTRDRKIVLRLHNNESNYYKALTQTTKISFKKLYYKLESHLLNKYQRLLPKDLCIASLSESDLIHFSSLQYSNLHFIPSFIPWQDLSSKSGTGEYCLYHGNLAISENEEAALWLVDHIFSSSSMPFIIAGNSPSNRLRKRVKALMQVQIIANPTEEKMEQLVRNAQLNVLPSFNTTGVKLKLLNALFNGRYCITNKAGVAGSNITIGVIIADNKKEMVEQANHFFTKSFTQNEAHERKGILNIYDNRINAQKLSALIS